MAGKICGVAKSCREKLAFLPPLLTRVAMGTVFLQSGWGKLHNLPKVIDFFQSLGIPAANIQAPFVAGIELVCGTAVLIGLLTRLAAVPLMGTMVVAIVTAKRADIGGFADLMGVEEYAFLLLLFWLAIYGAGAASVDRLLCRFRKKSDTTPS